MTARAESNKTLHRSETSEIKNKASRPTSNDLRTTLIVVGALGAVLVVVGAVTFALNAINNDYALAMIMTGAAFVSFGIGAIIACVKEHLNKKKKSEQRQAEQLIEENPETSNRALINDALGDPPTEGGNPSQKTAEMLQSELNEVKLKLEEKTQLANDIWKTVEKLRNEKAAQKRELEEKNLAYEKLKEQLQEEEMRRKAAETAREASVAGANMWKKEKDRIQKVLDTQREEYNQKIDDLRQKDLKIKQLEALIQEQKSLQANVEKQNDQLQEKLHLAVRDGNIDTVQAILNTATTKESFLALVASKSPMLRVAVAYCDNIANQPAIIKLILQSAAKFDALTDVLYYSEGGSRSHEKYCALVLDQAAAVVCVLQFLEDYPGPLKQLLEWEQPCSKLSLFQLAVIEDSKKNHNTVTVSILRAADTLNMCMSIVADKKYGISSLCRDDKELDPLVIRCILEAVKTPENQLAVIKLTQDEEGDSYFATGLSIAETLKYELFCRIRMKTDIQSIFEEEEDYCNEFAENGELVNALNIAKECANEQAADLLEAFLKKRQQKLALK